MAGDVTQGAAERGEQNKDPVKQVFQVGEEPSMNGGPLRPELLIRQRTTCRKHYLCYLLQDGI